jgi:hypothetical protein
LWSGNHNISGDPILANPLDGDFHLSVNSPCAGSGIDSLEVLNEIYNCPSVDIDYEPRPMPINTLPDMGIDEIEQSPQGSTSFIDNHESIFIYPNPSNSKISIITNALSLNKMTLSIFNINGQQLIKQPISEPKTEIDIKHISAGIYIIKIWDDDLILVQKVIKK